MTHGLNKRRELKTLGVAVLLLGVLALIYGAMGYDGHPTVLDVRGIKATVAEHRTIPIAPVAGVIALLSGVALLWAPRRRRA